VVNGAPAPKDQTKQLTPSASATTTPTTTPTRTTRPTTKNNDHETDWKRRRHDKDNDYKPTPTTAPTTTSTTAPPPKYVARCASEVPVNQAASFNIPSNGDPGIVIHTVTGEFVGYDAVCPHAGCTVLYSDHEQDHGVSLSRPRSSKVANGQVIVGPAPHGLTKLNIVESANGNLYLQ